MRVLWTHHLLNSERHSGVRRYRARHWRNRRQIAQGAKVGKIKGGAWVEIAGQPEPAPVIGVVGEGRIERLFCRLAHLEAAGTHHASPRICNEQVNGYCGLTGFTCPCLFAEPHDPQWDRIRESVRLAAQT